MAWAGIKLHDGTRLSLYLQEFAQECGPSCIATCSRLKSRKIGISQARHRVGKVDHNRPPGGGMGHNWGQDWAYMTSLTQALSSFGFRMAYTKKSQPTDRYKSFCQSRTKSKPGILRVEWADGSGHFVVTVGKNGATDQNFIEILDPAYGYQRVATNDFPNYRPRHLHTRKVVARGRLDRYWSVEVC